MSSSSATHTPFPHFATDAIHAGQEPEQWNSHAVVPPISVATTYKQIGPGETKGYDYTRGANPTRQCLEKCLAAIENAKYASAFASGLSACAAIFGMLNSGDHVVCSDDVYGGTNRFLRRVAKKNGIDETLTDASDVKNVENALKPNTKLVWIESPTNPLLTLCDITAVSKMVHEKSPGTLVVVDNTFMTPYLQRPLDLGADIVVHSITKYINGHTDVLMGCAMTNSKKLAEELSFYQMAVGAVPSPFDCYLVNRGIKTLALRMRQHSESGLRIARFLSKHSRVEKVLYPALESHPQFELQKRQCKGMSGMLSFYLKGGMEETKRFFQNLKVFTLAESLGGYESLVDHPAIMTHFSVPPEERAKLGIGDNLIRLSVGLEDVEDLETDLGQALAASAG
jgi:cystathionine gamma-lyase